VKERADLLAKAKKLAKLASSDGGGDESGDGGTFFKKSLEHEFDGRERHCLDGENE